MAVFRNAVFLAALAVAVATCAAAPQAADIDAAAIAAAPELVEPEVRGSSGAHAQMVFLSPFTSTAVFIDNYHPNFGDGIDLATGAHAALPFKDPDTDLFIFGTEYNLDTNTIRPLHPISNTFCSAGAFFPNGTMFNTGGAEPCEADGNCFTNQGRGPVKDGFDKIRTYNPGPCPAEGCTQDWVETGATIQRRRWYHSMQTLTDGSILMVGGSNVGGLVHNEPNINEANFEIARLDGSIDPVVDFPFLAFTDKDGPNKSYNLYPILHMLPNARGENQIFTLAGSESMVFDYEKNARVKRLPGIDSMRTFPASAMSVILPLTPANNYKAEVLVCGGSTGDRPDPKALRSCGRMQPLARNARWEMENMPDGSRVMGDMILLPNGEVFIVNGARHGSGGGHMAEVPALEPIIYDPKKPRGRRFRTDLPGSPIPRMYHSVACLVPSGEVMVAGSNPGVFYAPPGSVPGGNYPEFFNNGKRSFLRAQQNRTTSYPTEYRVEMFSPPYMSAPARPAITAVPAAAIAYRTAFEMTVDAALGCDVPVKLQLIYTGFATHGVHMGQRMVELEVLENTCGKITAAGPRDASVMPPGVYLLFAVQDGIPSKGEWVKLE